MWIIERQANGNRVVPRTKFSRIMNEKFNLLFMNSKVDVCSRCEIYKNKVNGNVEPEVNQVSWNLHLATSKRVSKFETNFNHKFRYAPEPVATQREREWNVLCQTSRVYNLTLVIHSRSKKQLKNRVFIYTWLETDTGKGSIEITSCLLHFFENSVFSLITRVRYNKIDLFCDSSPAQNKNNSMVCLLLKIANHSKLWKYIKELGEIYTHICNNGDTFTVWYVQTYSPLLIKKNSEQRWEAKK